MFGKGLNRMFGKGLNKMFGKGLEVKTESETCGEAGNRETGEREEKGYCKAFGIESRISIRGVPHVPG